MTLADLIGAILDGDFDGDADRIRDALAKRGDQLDARKAATLEVGDAVVFVSPVRPKYLTGVTAKVQAVHGTTLTLDVSRYGGGRYGGPGTECAVSFVEKIA